MTISVLCGSVEITAVVQGAFTIRTLDQVLPTFVDLTLQDEADVILDLTAVDEMDSAGTGLINALNDHLTAAGRRLIIASPHGQPLRMLMATDAQENMRFQFQEREQYALN